MTGGRAVPLLVVLSASAALAGACSEARASSTTGHKPSAVTSVTGSPGAHAVTLTAEAAARIRLQTAVVSQEAGTRTVPSAAALFDADGRSYVYTAPEPLSFVRVEIRVVADDGHTLRFSDGPAPGTRVVTTGVTEVYGAEFEVGH